jgi:hypothetical protein
MSFTLTLTLGASLLAIWLDARCRWLRPKTLAQGLIHSAVAVFSVLGAAELLVLLYGISDAAFMALVLGVFLPTLVYALLAGLWMLRAFANLTLAGR